MSKKFDPQLEEFQSCLTRINIRVSDVLLALNRFKFQYEELILTHHIVEATELTKVTRDGVPVKCLIQEKNNFLTYLDGCNVTL